MWRGRRRRHSSSSRSIRRRSGSSSNSSNNSASSLYSRHRRRQRASSHSWGRREAEEHEHSSRARRGESRSHTRRRKRNSYHSRRSTSSRHARPLRRRRRSYTYERSTLSATSSDAYDRHARRHISRDASRSEREHSRQRRDRRLRLRDNGQRVVSTHSTPATSSRQTMPTGSAPQPVSARNVPIDSEQKETTTSEQTSRVVVPSSSPRMADLAEQRMPFPSSNTPVKPVTLTQNTSEATTPLHSPLAARAAATRHDEAGAKAAHSTRQAQSAMPLLRDDAAYLRWLCGEEDVTGVAGVAPRTPSTAISLTLLPLSTSATSSPGVTTDDGQAHGQEISASGDDRRARAESRALRPSAMTSLASSAPRPTVDWRDVGPEKPFFVTSDYEALRRTPVVLPLSSLLPVTMPVTHATTSQSATDVLPDWRSSACEVFRRHFRTGKVHPKPPWYLCAAAEANCEHPYYIDWLDTVDILPLQEQLAVSRQAMAGQQGIAPRAPQSETSAQNAAVQTKMAHEVVH